MADYIVLPVIINTYQDIMSNGIEFGINFTNTHKCGIISTAENRAVGYISNSNQYMVGVICKESTSCKHVNSGYPSDTFNDNINSTSSSLSGWYYGTIYTGESPSFYIPPLSKMFTSNEYPSLIDLLVYIAGIDDTTYPITYHYTNSVLSGPSEAAVGDTVTVSAVPDVGYGITDASTQILVTNNDVAVPYTWDAANQRITFTMPEGAVTVTITASLIPTYPITYRPTRVTLDGPASAAVGATVNVDCTFPEGCGVKTTDSITVTCNRVPVPFSWDSENQRVTFTMPDPTA